MLGGLFRFGGSFQPTFYVMLKNYNRYLLTEAPKPGLGGKDSFGRMLVYAYLKQVRFRCVFLYSKDFLSQIQKPVILYQVWMACPGKRSVFKLRRCVCFSP